MYPMTRLMGLVMTVMIVPLIPAMPPEGVQVSPQSMVLHVTTVSSAPPKPPVPVELAETVLVHPVMMEMTVRWMGVVK